MPHHFSPIMEATYQGRLWTPELIKPMLEIWLDAADLTTINISNGLYRWYDKSGKGRYFSQQTAGYPVYDKSAFFGSPGIVFNGYAATNTMIADTNVAGKFSVILLIKPTEDYGGTSYRGIAAGNITNGFALLANLATGKWGTWGTSAQPSTQSLLANNPYIVIMDGTSSGNFYTNGSNSGAYDSTGGQTLGLSVGGGETSQQFVGVIASAIFCNIALTNAIRQKIEGYLAWRYAMTSILPPSHPYKNKPPWRGD